MTAANRLWIRGRIRRLGLSGHWRGPGRRDGRSRCSWLCRSRGMLRDGTWSVHPCLRHTRGVGSLWMRCCMKFLEGGVAARTVDGRRATGHEDRNADSLGRFLRRSAVTHRGVGVGGDAAVAAFAYGDREGDQLFGLRVECSRESARCHATPQSPCRHPGWRAAARVLVRAAPPARPFRNHRDPRALPFHCSSSQGALQAPTNPVLHTPRGLWPGPLALRARNRS